MKEHQTAWHLKQATTTALVLTDTGDPNQFSMMAKFPSGRIVTVRSTSVLHRNEFLDVSAYKLYTEKVIERLLAIDDNRSLQHTNWPSFMAAMQRLIIDFNEKRELKMNSKSVMVQ